MHQYFIIFLFKLSLMIIVSTSVIAANDSIKVYDKGLDGGVRYFHVTCLNGKNTTITQKILDTSAFEQDAPEIKIEDLVPEQQSTVATTAADIKQKFLDLISTDKIELCIISVNQKETCKKYKNINSATKAACDLVE